MTNGIPKAPVMTLSISVEQKINMQHQSNADGPLFATPQQAIVKTSKNKPFNLG
ncbi:MAG: hypothetical protein ACPH9T_07015 [Paracoccaceae bacterium]